MALQEARGRNDCYSDKVYRMPCGDKAVQLHLENATRLQEYSGKHVCVVGDVGTLQKIAWAIHHHNIPKISVNLISQSGRSEILNNYSGRPHDALIFRYDIVTVSTPTNDKKISEHAKWKSICEAHVNHLCVYPVGTAVLFKSYYYPQLDGVVYIPSAEPHNGSIIALIVGKVALAKNAHSLDEAWSVNHRHREECMNYAVLKTMFVFSREKVWERSPLRAPFFVGPPLAIILDAMDTMATGEEPPGFEEVEGDLEEPESSDEDYSEVEDQPDESDQDDPLERRPQEDILPVVTLKAPAARPTRRDRRLIDELFPEVPLATTTTTTTTTAVTTTTTSTGMGTHAVISRVSEPESNVPPPPPRERKEKKKAGRGEKSREMDDFKDLDPM